MAKLATETRQREGLLVYLNLFEYTNTLIIKTVKDCFSIEYMLVKQLTMEPPCTYKQSCTQSIKVLY